MQTPYFSFLALAAALAFSACSSPTADQPAQTAQTAPATAEAAGAAAAPTPAAAADKMCFLEAVNKDTTTVTLQITGDSVRGEMRWNPYQKDGARGTLRGRKTAAGELEVLYRYTIEGNAQTETKIMKLDAAGNLLVKKGELLDPQNDGHLVFKNAAQATYGRALPRTACR